MLIMRLECEHQSGAATALTASIDAGDAKNGCCCVLQAWTEQAQEEDADVDAELSEGGEWGDSSTGSEDDSFSSEEESSQPRDDSSTQQGDSASFAPASTVFSSCDMADGNSSSESKGSDTDSNDSSNSSSSSEVASEAGPFADPSLSIPPNLPVPLRRDKRQKDGARVRVRWLQHAEHT
jgi:hypothetical protein